MRPEALEGAEAAGTSEAPAPDAVERVATSAASGRAEHAAVVRELRSGVRDTLDEWLRERSNTVSLAVAQLVEDALVRVKRQHDARVSELETRHAAQLATLEREHAEALRGASRRRRARMRAVERELRDRIEQLERNLTAATLETVDRLREVERRESERRIELEREWSGRVREKEDEILRMRKTGEAPDTLFDSLHDQLRFHRDRS